MLAPAQAFLTERRPLAALCRHRRAMAAARRPCRRAQCVLRARLRARRRARARPRRRGDPGVVRRHAAAAGRPVPVPGNAAPLRREAPGAHGLDPSVRAAGNAAGRSRCSRGRGGVVSRPSRSRCDVAEASPAAAARRIRAGRAGAARRDRTPRWRARRVRPAPARSVAAGGRRRALRRTRDREKAPQGIQSPAPPPRRSRSGRHSSCRAAPPPWPPRCRDFLALEAKGWKGAAGTALVQAPELRRFAEAAVDALARQGQARVARLLLGLAADRLHRDAPEWRRRMVLEDRL